MKENIEPHELEIVKAVAQAWLGHTTTTSPPSSTNEFDTRRLCFKNKPTRFQLESISKPSWSNNNDNRMSTSWDFTQSLWDSYEIVAVSRRLESGLLLDNEFDESSKGQSHGQASKKKKESKNSLRNVLSRTSSRRVLISLLSLIMAVIKIKVGDKIRRLHAAGLDHLQHLDTLKQSISILFALDPNADFTITYIDEDEDVITLCDDFDLRELKTQSLNPVRMTVTLNQKNRISKPSVTSTEISTPVNPTHDDFPDESLNSAVHEILKFIPGKKYNEFFNLMLDAACINKMAGGSDTKEASVKKDGVPNSGSESVQTFPGSLAVHKGVICDGCRVSPITGPRFMSKWMIEFDLCSACFEKTGHDSADYVRLDFSLGSNETGKKDPEVVNQDSEACKKKSNGVVENEDMFFDAELLPVGMAGHVLPIWAWFGIIRPWINFMRK